MGQDLRKLAFDLGELRRGLGTRLGGSGGGGSGERLFGVDVSEGMVRGGEMMFGGEVGGGVVMGDLLGKGGEGMVREELGRRGWSVGGGGKGGRVAWVAKVLHLFGWEAQVRLVVALVGLMVKGVSAKGGVVEEIVDQYAGFGDGRGGVSSVNGVGKGDAAAATTAVASDKAVVTERRINGRKVPQHLEKVFDEAFKRGHGKGKQRGFDAAVYEHAFKMGLEHGYEEGYAEGLDHFALDAASEDVDDGEVAVNGDGGKEVLLPNGYHDHHENINGYPNAPLQQSQNPTTTPNPTLKTPPPTTAPRSSSATNLASSICPTPGCSRSVSKAPKRPTSIARRR